MSEIYQIHVKYNEEKIMEMPGVGETEPHPRICEHCGNKTIFTILAIDQKTDSYEAKDWTLVETSRLLKCKTCLKLVLEKITVFSEDWYPDYEPSVCILYPIASY